jgi:uncharacterized protein (DUF488 family)
MKPKTVPAEAEWPKDAIFTVGHSTLPIEDFIGLLNGFGIDAVADVRTIPKSRHNPQFGGEALAASLKAEGIDYIAMPGLGGLRHAKPDSPNAAWRNKSFRGYADYMQTEGFHEALQRLIGMGRQKRTAIMCAEAVPWRCHRSLVADALMVHGIPAVEILGPGKARAHKLTPFAQVSGDTITYPPEQGQLL